MFGWFKRKAPAASIERADDPPFEAPTERQLSYAKRLGISVDSTTSKDDLSAAIADAERRDPPLAEKRAEAIRQAYIAKWGAELVALEEEWDEFAAETSFMLAIYRHGRSTMVDVLYVDSVKVIDRGKLVLLVAGPKLVKDRYVGDSIEWITDFELPIENLVRHESLHPDFCDEPIHVYKATIERGLKLAAKL